MGEERRESIKVMETAIRILQRFGGMG